MRFNPTANEAKQGYLALFGTSRIFTRDESGVCNVPMSKSTCKRPGFVRFEGIHGNFYWCRKHFKRLQLVCDDIMVFKEAH